VVCGAAANAITGVSPSTEVLPYGSSIVAVPVTLTGTCPRGRCFVAFTPTANCSDQGPVVAPTTLSFVYTFGSTSTYTVCYSSDNTTFQLQRGVNITIVPGGMAAPGRSCRAAAVIALDDVTRCACHPYTAQCLRRCRLLWRSRRTR
jgi:hypothetical protein